MSIAGVRSQRGYTYQAYVALDWVATALLDSKEEIVSVALEATGITRHGPDFNPDPESSESPTTVTPTLVDDVVVTRSDGFVVYIQAKRNNSANREWRLTDAELKKEAVHACEQLEKTTESEVLFYSASDFGRFKQLTDQAGAYDSIYSFRASAPQTTLQKELRALAKLLDRTEAQTYGLVRRMGCRLTPAPDEYPKTIEQRLARLFSDPAAVADLLLRRISEASTRHGGASQTLSINSLRDELISRGHVPQGMHDDEHTLELIRLHSRQNRSWPRTIDAHTLVRPEAERAFQAAQKSGTTLVTGAPGSGKTCVLLDLVDRFEDRGEAVLFVKADTYSHLDAGPDLASFDLPTDLAPRLIHLGRTQPVRVILDGLDVLSLMREGGMLALLLRFADQIAGAQGISVVAACRSFDVLFTPQLRDRKWNAQIEMEPLPLNEVERMLAAWGVDPGELGAAVLEMLRVPLHLKLYGELVRLGDPAVSAAPYALHQRYLDVVVERASGLGSAAMRALERAATDMQQRRRLSAPRAVLRAGHTVVDGLISAGVLAPEGLGRVRFAHQELLDVVAVGAAVREGRDLLSTILASPALPFIRPTIRTHLFLLRTSDPQGFRRQARRILDHADVAYHLKRLVVESLAATDYDPADDSLLRYMRRDHLVLFDRAVNRMELSSWLPYLVSIIEEVIVQRHPSLSPARILSMCEKWATSHPDTILNLWSRAMAEKWEGEEFRYQWDAVRAVEKVVEAELESPPASARPLIDALMQKAFQDEHVRYSLARVIEKWVQITNQDDDWVWQCFQFDESTNQARGFTQHFGDSFIAQRLIASDRLLDRTIAFLSEQSKANTHLDRIRTFDDLRWGLRTDGSIRNSDALESWTGALVQSLAGRAECGDSHWLSIRDDLLRHSCLPLRGAALQAVQIRGEGDATAIFESIVRTKPDHQGWALDEFCRLLSQAYPHLSDEQRVEHQNAILQYHEARSHEHGEAEWRVRRTASCLSWVPRPWRSPETNAFLAPFEKEADLRRPPEQSGPNAQFVPSPIRCEPLSRLGPKEAVRLAEHYPRGIGSEWIEGQVVGGGSDQAQNSFTNAAQSGPRWALQTLSALMRSDAEDGYLDAVVSGAGRYFNYRFGNTQADRWTDNEPDHDHLDSVHALLRIVEQHFDLSSDAPHLWLETDAAVRAIEGISLVLGGAHVEQDVRVEHRLITVMVRIWHQSRSDLPDASHASSGALNHAHGILATASMRLVGRIAARKSPLPPMLIALIQCMAQVGNAAIGWAIMSQLPYFTQFRPDIGWSLAERVLDTENEQVWEIAGSLFYYNYHEAYDRVMPFLERAKASNLAPETRGRIQTLDEPPRVYRRLIYVSASARV